MIKSESQRQYYVLVLGCSIRGNMYVSISAVMWEQGR